MNIPAGLKYTKVHEWVKIEGNTATVGITDFAQGELGDIVYVDINSVGQTVEHGQIFGTVEAVKTVSDLYMPVSGKVLEVNPALDKNLGTRHRAAIGLTEETDAIVFVVSEETKSISIVSGGNMYPNAELSDVRKELYAAFGLKYKPVYES